MVTLPPSMTAQVGVGVMVGVGIEVRVGWMVGVGVCVGVAVAVLVGRLVDVGEEVGAREKPCASCWHPLRESVIKTINGRMMKRIGLCLRCMGSIVPNRTGFCGP